MPSINDTCEALAAVLDDVTGLRAKGYADDQINPPEAHVYTRDFDPRMTLGNSPKRVFLLGVRLFVKRTDPRSAQKSLRGFMEPSGATSVLAAIENETAWSVTVDDAEVTSIGQPFEYETADTIYWAVDFDVDVIW